MKTERIKGNPIITPEMDDSIGTNINGPSLIKVPDWIEEPLGRYYLYFAHHSGKYIRMAYADKISGPWQIYQPGTLQLSESYFAGHIASPDLHVDHQRHLIKMYYHGGKDLREEAENQATRLAVSGNGINFLAFPEILGGSYMRIFEWRGAYYSVEMHGVLVRRSEDGVSDFKPGPIVFKDLCVRHLAVKRRQSTLYIFFTLKEDKPERILYSTVDLSRDWLEWEESEINVLIEPELDYEGANLPLEASRSGSSEKPVRQLRDPGIFSENGQTHLLHTVAGERGIAACRLSF